LGWQQYAREINIIERFKQPLVAGNDKPIQKRRIALRLREGSTKCISCCTGARRSLHTALCVAFAASSWALHISGKNKALAASILKNISAAF
jgi:hypothetical protein